MGTYKITIQWLFKQLPMFQRVGAMAYKKDLTNIKSLVEYLNHPQKKYPTIHIAGTNGKGSCSHMLASLLQEAGYKVGLSTSPHLKDFRERIRVNGNKCSKNFVIDFVVQHKNQITQQKASFFEVTTAMAFTYFEKQKVDVAIIETGLGGRLDSSNVVEPILSVITNIGLDHTQFLGNTLAEIATEKAGIIKPKTPIVIGETLQETKPVFEEVAQKNQSKIIFANQEMFSNYESDLKGNYQEKNKQTVFAAVKELQLLGFKITDENIKEGFLKVTKNTGLRGRWDVLENNPLVVADTAHNVDGLSEVVKQIESIPYQKLHLVLGFVNDKNVAEILELFPKDAQYYFCAPNVPRKLPVDELRKIIPKSLNATFYPSVNSAFKSAKKNAENQDFIFIGGSTFVVAEVI